MANCKHLEYRARRTFSSDPIDGFDLVCHYCLAPIARITFSEVCLLRTLRPGQDVLLPGPNAQDKIGHDRPEYMIRVALENEEVPFRP